MRQFSYLKCKGDKVLFSQEKAKKKKKVVGSGISCHGAQRPEELSDGAHILQQ